MELMFVFLSAMAHHSGLINRERVFAQAMRMPARATLYCVAMIIGRLIYISEVDIFAIANQPANIRFFLYCVLSCLILKDA